MKRAVSIFTAVFCLLWQFSNATAAEEEKADLRIKELLDREPQIAAYIPGLAKEKDDSGKELYTYNGQPIDKMSKDDADKLYGRAQNEYVRLRTDRLTRDLNRTRQASQYTVPRMPQTPRTPRPPQIPKVPRMPSRTQR